MTFRDVFLWGLAIGGGVALLWLGQRLARRKIVQVSTTVDTAPHEVEIEDEDDAEEDEDDAEYETTWPEVAETLGMYLLLAWVAWLFFAK